MQRVLRSLLKAVKMKAMSWSQLFKAKHSESLNLQQIKEKTLLELNNLFNKRQNSKTKNITLQLGWKHRCGCRKTFRLLLEVISPHYINLQL